MARQYGPFCFCAKGFVSAYVTDTMALIAITKIMQDTNEQQKNSDVPAPGSESLLDGDAVSQSETLAVQMVELNAGAGPAVPTEPVRTNAQPVSIAPAAQELVVPAAKKSHKKLAVVVAALLFGFGWCWRFGVLLFCAARI